MTLTHFAIIAVCAYLLGSLSFAIIVSKLTLGKDIRNYGSGNAGLTNAYRTMGAKKTLLVLLGDIAKGAAAVSIGMVLAGPVGKLTAGIFVILGHMFPLYFGFKGGKGVLVGAVMLAFFDWRVFGIAFALFLLSVIVTKWISLGSILGAVSFPITTWVFYRDPVRRSSYSCTARISDASSAERKTNFPSRARKPCLTERRLQNEGFCTGHRRLGHRAGDAAASERPSGDLVDLSAGGM